MIQTQTVGELPKHKRALDFFIETQDTNGQWKQIGKVHVKVGATDQIIRNALMRLHVLAPRESDTLVWLDYNIPAAIVYDMDNNPIVKLVGDVQ